MERPVDIAKIECTKNPNHLQFIRTSKFKLNNIPTGFRSQLIWALINSKAVLTVKLVVNKISPGRPVEFQVLYPDKNIGSGHVTGLDKSDPDCIIVTVDTAAHVVFDDYEAANTIAKFYHYYNPEVFQLKCGRLLNSTQRLRRLNFKIDESMRQFLKPRKILTYIENALKPSIYNSLLHSVVMRYTVLSLPWLEFLYSEIKCIKSMRVVSGTTRMLEIKLDISHILLLDVMLLLIALVSSGPGHITNLMQKFLVNCDSQPCKVEKPFIKLISEDANNNANQCFGYLTLDRFLNMDHDKMSVINRDFTVLNNITLHKIMECLSKSDIAIDQLNEALAEFSTLKIHARKIRSDVIFLEIPLTSADLLDSRSLEVTLNPEKVEIEQETGKHVAVMISHPHNSSQHITLGYLTNSPSDSEPTYTTPSCEGSSGAQVLMIPGNIQSLEEIENISAVTHSGFRKRTSLGFGNRFK